MVPNQVTQPHLKEIQLFYRTAVTAPGKPSSKGEIPTHMSSEEIIIPVLGIFLPIILTLGAYIMVVFLRKYQNIERMAMIEKGVSPDMFRKERENTRHPGRCVVHCC